MAHAGKRITVLAFLLAGVLTAASSGVSAAPPPQGAAAEAKPPPLPLKTTRTIAFDTDEGTWLSLDVSPDGTSIVFELLGDIYVLPIAGGEAKLVLGGNAWDSQPRFSPDGKRIVFVSDRDGAQNVWTAGLDGADLRQITKETQGDFVSPAFTPDGRFVMTARDSDVFGGRELWLYDIGGGAGVQVTKASPAPKTPSDEQLNVAGPTASPDGRYVYYSQRHGILPYNVHFPLWQIARRDRRTGDEDVITNEPGSAFRPLLSPDGQTLVYGTRVEAKTGLKVRNLRTGEEHWLKLPVDRDEQEGLASRDLLPGYAFTPDGRSVIVSFSGHIHRLSIDGREDHVIPFSAHVSQALGPLLNFPGRVDEGPVVSRMAEGPKASPSGASAVYSAFAHIYLKSFSGGEPTRLTKDETPAFQPTWSPDGRFVAYVTWDHAGGALWKAPTDGSSPPLRLTKTPAFYTSPVFSPDGREIIALRSSVAARYRHDVEFNFGPAPGAPETEIVAVSPSAAGGSKAAPDAGVRVIAMARDRVDPHFASDPARIYFTSGRGLVSIRLDGSEERIAVKVEGLNTQGQKEPAPATTVKISPDGRFALALVNHQVQLLSLPEIGGAPPEVDIAHPSVRATRLSIAGADEISWSADGTQMFWSLGATLFRLPLTEALAPTPPEDPSSKPDPKGRPTRFKPEEISLAVAAARATPKGDLLIQNVRLITMHGDEVLEAGDLWIHDNRIAAIGPHGAVAAPKGARVMDLSGTTIMPGIIDIHAHWTQIRRSVLDLDSWPLLANLAYGVTSGRDPQTFTPDIFAYQDLIDAGRMPGPRTYSTGVGVFRETDIRSLQDAEDTLSRYKTFYRTNLIKSYEVGDRQQRQWLVTASEKLKMMPTTEGGIDTRLDLTHVLDGYSGNEHNLPQIPIYKDIVTLLGSSGTTYTPTLLVNYGGPEALNAFLTGSEVHEDLKLQTFIPHDVLNEITSRVPWSRTEEYVYADIARQAAKIVHAGGRVGVGGHGMMQGLQCHWEMWALAAGGMTPLEVIRSGTLSGAEAIGLSADLGSLEVGKLADFVILEKNPLEDIHNTNTIRLVVKNGEIFNGADLSEIWPLSEKRAPGWWVLENAERRKAALEH